MKRRDFLSTSCLAGLGAITLADGARAEETSSRDYYELRQYLLDGIAQQKRLDSFLESAFIPALNRMGIDHVGVFHQYQPSKDIIVYVLIRHRSARSVLTLTSHLLEDKQFMSDGADFLDLPASDPGYARMKSSVVYAFKKVPSLEIPSKTKGRIFQLRTYQSPTVKTGQKKIEMFNDGGELDIFRQSGLHPVFFGETIIGDKMPNLTYMLVFDNMEQRKTNWRKFVSSPQWKRLSTKPEYADKTILCGITNIFLKPAVYSQI